MLAFLMLAALFFTCERSNGDETSISEGRAKALFLCNFAKYVDWPDQAFATPSGPLIIGICGENDIQSELEKAVSGKTIGGRAITVLRFKRTDEIRFCHILFIKTSHKTMPEVLRKLKGLPMLTVGQSDDFIADGGIINFIKKDNKMHLTINLSAAQEANLRISSKLLSVADVVKEKEQ